MELNDTSKEGIGKFALEIIKKYGKQVVFDLIAALFKHAWDKDPKEEDAAHTEGDGHNCKPDEKWDVVQGRCVPNVGV